jgi:hypothetical protein
MFAMTTLFVDEHLFGWKFNQINLKKTQINNESVNFKQQLQPIFDEQITCSKGYIFEYK